MDPLLSLHHTRLKYWNLLLNKQGVPKPSCTSNTYKEKALLLSNDQVIPTQQPVFGNGTKIEKKKKKKKEKQVKRDTEEKKVRKTFGSNF